MASSPVSKCSLPEDQTKATPDMVVAQQNWQDMKKHFEHYGLVPWGYLYPYSVWGNLTSSPTSYGRVVPLPDMPREDMTLAGNFSAKNAGIHGGFLRFQLPRDFKSVMWPQINGGSISGCNSHEGKITTSKITKFTIDEILGQPSSEDSEKPKDLSVSSSRDGHSLAKDIQSPLPLGVGEDPLPLSHHSTDRTECPQEDYSWLQCTRYRPPKLPRIKRKEGVKKRKLGRNPRIPFTQHQVNTLEEKFRHTHYLSSVDVAELSAQLNLTETRVKIWFQNRRARERRDRENKKEVIVSSSGCSTAPTKWSLPGTTTYPRPLWEPGPARMNVLPPTPLCTPGVSAFSPVVRGETGKALTSPL